MAADTRARSKEHAGVVDQIAGVQPIAAVDDTGSVAINSSELARPAQTDGRTTLISGFARAGAPARQLSALLLPT